MENLLSIQYVHDTLLFVNTNTESITCLKLLLYEFGLATDLKINFPKSLVYQLDVAQNNNDNIANILNC